VTADRLARHYAVLRPDERLALMLATVARGDDTEHERLAAAPRATVTTLHRFPRAVAFREVLDRVRAERLALAARYFQARYLAVAAGRPRGTNWPTGSARWPIGVSRAASAGRGCSAVPSSRSAGRAGRGR
jgi:hypothetical protein